MGNRSNIFSVKMTHITEKIGEKAKEEVTKLITGFVTDMSKQIIKYSPVFPEAKYSQGNYIANTVIYGTRGTVVKVPVVDSEDDTRSWKSSRPPEILGLSTILQQCSDWKSIPKTITIENATQSDNGYDYWYNVEVEGWSHTAPYSPFRKALEFVSNKYSGSFTITSMSLDFY